MQKLLSLIWQMRLCMLVLNIASFICKGVCCRGEQITASSIFPHLLPSALCLSPGLPRYTLPIQCQPSQNLNRDRGKREWKRLLILSPPVQFANNLSPCFFFWGVVLLFFFFPVLIMSSQLVKWRDVIEGSFPAGHKCLQHDYSLVHVVCGHTHTNTY